jgi:formyltetrahydrofolate deformylase
MSASATLVALLSGPDQPGLVARVAGWIFEHRGNILHADQHRDMEAGIFFQRVEWEPLAPDADAAPAFVRFATSLGMEAKVTASAHRPRVAIFVSKADHCFHDLALRWRAGEFAADFVAVISNHREIEAAARGYGLEFYHLPVTAQTKAEAERRQLDLLRAQGVELVILARFMQILSAGFLAEFGQPVINIHHSFLPAFAGGRPYHQAHARGVKLIGATAHYVTEELDEGPIIEQSVERVGHNLQVDDYVAVGRDVEALVLARAVKWHAEHRVLLNGSRTVVFQ